MLKRGFTLIEVLVTLVILMFGLLGIAGLMAKGQRVSFEAFQRQQALSLANDMAERQRANRLGSLLDTYSIGAPPGTPLGLGAQYSLLGTSITNCAVSTCSTVNLANYDLAEWDGLLFGYGETQIATGTRVGGIVNARGCIEKIATTLPLCGATDTGIPYTVTNRISVAWQGQEDTGVPARPSACGTGLYGASDGLRRLVSLDVMLQLPCP